MIYKMLEIKTKIENRKKRGGEKEDENGKRKIKREKGSGSSFLRYGEGTCN